MKGRTTYFLDVHLVKPAGFSVLDLLSDGGRRALTKRSLRLQGRKETSGGSEKTCLRWSDECRVGICLWMIDEVKASFGW